MSKENNKNNENKNHKPLFSRMKDFIEEVAEENDEFATNKSDKNSAQHINIQERLDRLEREADEEIQMPDLKKLQEQLNKAKTNTSSNRNKDPEKSPQRPKNKTFNKVIKEKTTKSNDKTIFTKKDTRKTDTDNKKAKKARFSLKDKLLKNKNIKESLPKITFKSTGEKIEFYFNVILGVIKKLAIYLAIIVVLGVALVGGAGIGYFASLVRNTEPPSQEKMAQAINQLELQSSLYYANGEKIANVRSDVSRSVVELSEVSPLIIDAFIATEDENFYEHPGVVPKAIIRAALENLIKGSGTGGSTITQQLVKQQFLSDEVTFSRKANEILMALRLENHFSKDEILQAYLNVSPFGRNNKGENVAGIKQASIGIFGVEPSQVNLNQAAFLAGLPQDPYRYTPYNQYGEMYTGENLEEGIDRMKEVLYRMYRDEKISKEEYLTSLDYDISKDFIKTEERQDDSSSYLYQAVMHGTIEELMKINIENDGFTWEQINQDDEWYNDYYFKAEDELRNGGYQVYTTIDRQIYDQLQKSAAEYEDELGVAYDGIYTDPETGHQEYYVETVQTGLVVIENETGRVLGFVAGTDFENNQIDHAFQMHRSPGSTIKPLAVYGPAVQHNIITPATVIPDTAFVKEYEDGSVWAPTNYGYVVSGENMTARTALLKSDNLPAVRIYEEMQNQGVPIIDYLDKMGFDLVDSYTQSDVDNLASSLGGVTTGPTVFEETRAFTTFANNGHYIDGYYIERIEDPYGNIIYQHDSEPVQVFDEDTNYLMVDMLRDTMTQGTGRTANEYKTVPGDWIAKTGISENSKDIWVLASTPSITVGSWIGYDSRYDQYTIDVNDGYGLESVRSQIYWARIVNDLYAIRPEIFGSDRTFTKPDSVIEQNIVTATGTLPGTIVVNGQAIQVSGPLNTEIFKASSPAPELTYDFLLGATEDEQAGFWNSYVMSLTKPKDKDKDKDKDKENVEDPNNPETEENSENQQNPPPTEGNSVIEEVAPATPLTEQPYNNQW